MLRNAKSDPPGWKTVSTRQAFANHWLGVEVDTVILPNGQPYEYTRIIPAAPGVGVIGFDTTGKVLLEREYRHGIGAVIWQLPGGLADEGEDLLSAGLRELLEETGHAPAERNDQTVRYLGSVWDNPAFGPMVSHIYAVRGLEKVADTKRDHGEELTLHWVSPDWLTQAVGRGEIHDRVVISAVAWLLLEGWL